MNMKRFVWGVLCLLILSACAATGPIFTSVEPPSDSQATVYIYRSHYFANRNSYPHVYLNNEQKDPIKDEGYLVYRVSPGKTALEIRGNMWNWPTSVLLKLEPNLEAKKIYYFRLRFEPIDRGTRHILEQVSEAEAMTELSSKRLSQ